MKREIKFRAWDTREGRMFNVQTICPGIGATEDDRWGDKGHYIPDCRLELMQFTGLKDKNGKEIYEGDIVKRNNRVKTATPDWSTKNYVVNWDKVEAKYMLNDETTWGMIYELEVIGNQYENPELLEGGEDK